MATTIAKVETKWVAWLQLVLAMLVVQVFSTGLQLLSRVILTNGTFIFALTAYRFMVAAFCVAPFALFFERLFCLFLFYFFLIYSWKFYKILQIFMVAEVMSQSWRSSLFGYGYSSIQRCMNSYMPLFNINVSLLFGVRLIMEQWKGFYIRIMMQVNNGLLTFILWN